jgi:hypothetical protein
MYWGLNAPPHTERLSKLYLLKSSWVLGNVNRLKTNVQKPGDTESGTQLFPISNSKFWILTPLGAGIQLILRACMNCESQSLQIYQGHIFTV